MLHMLKDACCQASCLNLLWYSSTSLCLGRVGEEQQAADIAIRLRLASVCRPMDAIHISVSGATGQLCLKFLLDCCAGVDMVWVRSQG